MDALADWVLGRVLKDLDFYYDQGAQDTQPEESEGVGVKVLRDELKTVLLEEKDKQLMVISHSMGTIIGYDVLRDLGMPGTESGVTVDEFVTIGSPARSSPCAAQDQGRTHL